MADADPRLSRLVLAYTALGAAANLASSVRRRGARRTAVFLALAIGLPAAGELLATGPLKLLRHRTRPRVAGVPLAILLGWYNAIEGSFALAERVLNGFSLNETNRKRARPPVAALVGASLDLALDPAGLDAGLWEWKRDGLYASEVRGPNGRRGVPLVNYLGWLSLVWGVADLDGRVPGYEATGRGVGRLPVLILLPYYLSAVAWAVRRRRFRYLVRSALFPAAVLVEAARG